MAKGTLILGIAGIICDENEKPVMFIPKTRFEKVPLPSPDISHCKAVLIEEGAMKAKGGVECEKDEECEKILPPWIS